MGRHPAHLHPRDGRAPESSGPAVGLKQLRPDGDWRPKAELFGRANPVATGAAIEHQPVASRRLPPPIEAVLIGGLVAASIANAILLLTS